VSQSGSKRNLGVVVFLRRRAACICRQRRRGDFVITIRSELPPSVEKSGAYGF
jgi:hypothetical protein